MKSFMRTNAIFLMVMQLTCGGCLAQTPSEPANDQSINGKFLIVGVRDSINIRNEATYVLENKKLRKIAGELGSPKWSPSGNQIIASDANKNLLYVLNAKGEILKSIKTEGYPVKFDWFQDENKIIYSTKESFDGRKSFSYRIFTYNFNTEQADLIHTFENNQHVMDLKLSQDGRKFAFYVQDIWHNKSPKQLGVFDLETKEVKILRPSFMVIGWLPDSEHIIVQGNMKDDGTKMSPLGVTAKINVNTGEFQVLRNETQFYFQRALSKDGKYIFYIRENKETKCVYINELATDKETQITFPTKINNTNYLSVDTYADWYQGE